MLTVVPVEKRSWITENEDSCRIAEITVKEHLEKIGQWVRVKRKTGQDMTRQETKHNEYHREEQKTVVCSIKSRSMAKVEKSSTSLEMDIHWRRGCRGVVSWEVLVKERKVAMS